MFLFFVITSVLISGLKSFKLCRKSNYFYENAALLNPDIETEINIINSFPIAKWFNYNNLNELSIYNTTSNPTSCLNLIVLNELEIYKNFENYKSFINLFKKISNPLFILEPNAIHKIIKEQKQFKPELIYALSNLNNVYVELSHWLISSENKQNLINIFLEMINLTGFKGVILNVSNYKSTQEIINLCNIFNSYLSRNITCLIDTSRNFADTNNEWCNSKRAGIGEPPDILNNKVWVKQPGLSDGLCGNSKTPGGEFDKSIFISQYNNGWFINNNLKKIKSTPPTSQKPTSSPIIASTTPNTNMFLTSEYVLEGARSLSENGVKILDNSVFMESRFQPRICKTRDGKYEKFNLNDKTIEYVVDISNVKCGFNFAVYFVEMDLNATPGFGYCDAQMDGNGCVEMDLTESNVVSNHLTSHPCKNGFCDKSGNVAKVLFNNVDFKRIKYSTFFNRKEGKITQKLYQNDQLITILELSNDLEGIFNSFDNGMVLVISLWTSPDQMVWLNGKCDSYNSNEIITAKISDIKIY